MNDLHRQISPCVKHNYKIVLFVWVWHSKSNSLPYPLHWAPDLLGPALPLILSFKALCREHLQVKLLWRANVGLFNPKSINIFPRVLLHWRARTLQKHMVDVKVDALIQTYFLQTSYAQLLSEKLRAFRCWWTVEKCSTRADSAFLTTFTTCLTFRVFSWKQTTEIVHAEGFICRILYKVKEKWRANKTVFHMFSWFPFFNQIGQCMIRYFFEQRLIKDHKRKNFSGYWRKQFLFVKSSQILRRSKSQ